DAGSGRTADQAAKLAGTSRQYVSDVTGATLGRGARSFRSPRPGWHSAAVTMPAQGLCICDAAELLYAAVQALHGAVTQLADKLPPATSQAGPTAGGSTTSAEQLRSVPG
ncbi:MAG TPA: hypothetical protein VIK18_22910, partial [Pirellulales bacterium]